MTAQLVQAGGGRDACGICGNRCHGALCDRCARQLQDADRERAQLARRELQGVRYAPR